MSGSPGTPATLEARPPREGPIERQARPSSSSSGIVAAETGATGTTAITREVIDRLRDEAIVASGSSRQLEIDMAYLRECPARRVKESVEAIALPAAGRRLLLVNDGFPVNFMPGSQSVPDEIVEMILGELMILLCDLARSEIPPGLHRITPAQEAICAELWLELRDGAAP